MDNCIPYRASLSFFVVTSRSIFVFEENYLIYLKLHNFLTTLTIKGEILPTAPGLLQTFTSPPVASVAPKNSMNLGILNLACMDSQIS